MTYTRTQVYLTPEDHRRLSERAKKQGKPLTALLREIVADYLRRGPESDAERSFDAIVGIVEDGEPTDVARDGRGALREAREERSRKKLGRDR